MAESNWFQKAVKRGSGLERYPASKRASGEYDHTYAVKRLEMFGILDEYLFEEPEEKYNKE